MILGKTNYNILSQFEKLWTTHEEVHRKDILENIISKIDIERLIEKIKQSNTDDLLENTIISWAWMIKIKILEHQNGSIRLHMFDPDNLSSNLFNNVEWEPHIHDFQWISKILLWQIFEESYQTYEPKKNQIEQYNLFLNRAKHLNNNKQQQILWEIEETNIKDEDALNIISQNNLDSSNIIDLYHIYDSIKNNSKKEIIETFNDIWILWFKKDWTRIIKSGETYFLPADRWHKIINKSKAITLFINDKTYKSCWFMKNKNTILRGHGKKFPRLQIKEIKRNIPENEKCTKNLYSLINLIES